MVMNEIDQYACAGDLLKLDIGKTHTKLVRMTKRGNDECVGQIASPTCRGPSYPAIDVEKVFEWFMKTASLLPDKDRITAILPVAHGAAFAALNSGELCLPVMDYEFDPPNHVNQAYRAIRPQFSETGSPEMPGMLNGAKQLFYLAERHTSEFAQIDAIVPLAQYFSFRLSGKLCNEVSAMGCHTDLWNPHAGQFSTLVEQQEWSALFPAFANAERVIGCIRPDIAQECGVNRDVAILAGGHDSSIEIAPHLGADENGTVILTTGTWFVLSRIASAQSADEPVKNSARTMSIDHREMSTMRFMGGRLIEKVAASGDPAEIEDLSWVLENQLIFMPPGNVRSTSFKADAAQNPHADDGQKAVKAAATCHLVLVTLDCLQKLGEADRVVVLGRFASDPVFIAAMRLFAPNTLVRFPIINGSGNPIDRVFQKPGYDEISSHSPKFKSELISLAHDYRLCWEKRQI